MKRFLKYARLPGNLIGAFKVACVIAPVLTLMNHWGEIAAMRLDFIFWLQMLLTFTVPFSASLFSSAGDIPRGAP